MAVGAPNSWQARHRPRLRVLDSAMWEREFRREREQLRPSRLNPPTPFRPLPPLASLLPQPSPTPLALAAPRRTRIQPTCRNHASGPQMRGDEGWRGKASAMRWNKRKRFACQAGKWVLLGRLARRDLNLGDYQRSRH